MTIPNARILAVALLVFPVIAMAELPRLTVNVTGAEPATGTLEISVFDSEEKFLREIFLQKKCRPEEDGTCTVEFAAVTEGEYAVAVIHDANDNKKLDNGFLGFGAERFGFSNNPSRPWFGRNSFDDAKFSLTESTVIQVDLD